MYEVGLLIPAGNLMWNDKVLSPWTGELLHEVPSDKDRQKQTNPHHRETPYKP